MMLSVLENISAFLIILVLFSCDHLYKLLETFNLYQIYPYRLSFSIFSFIFQYVLYTEVAIFCRFLRSKFLWYRIVLSAHRHSACSSECIWDGCAGHVFAMRPGSGCFWSRPDASGPQWVRKRTTASVFTAAAASFDGWIAVTSFKRLFRPQN